MTFRLNEKTAHQGTVQPMLPISQSLRGSGLDLKLLFEWGEGRLPSIATILAPAFRPLAREARRRGMDRDLEARYSR